MLKGEQFLTEIYEMLWKVSDKLGKKMKHTSTLRNT